MTKQQAISSPRRKKVFSFIAVVAAGFAICTLMKAFICGKSGDRYPCQAASDPSDDGCSASEEA